MPEGPTELLDRPAPPPKESPPVEAADKPIEPGIPEPPPGLKNAGVMMLPEPIKPPENPAQTELDKLYADVQKLPKEIQIEADKILNDENFSPNTPEGKKRLDDFISISKGRVDEEGKKTLDSLQRLAVDGSISPTDIMTSVDKALDSKYSSPEEKKLSQEAKAALHDLVPELEAALELEEQGKDVPEESQKNIRKYWEHAKKPLLLLGFGFIGMLIMMIMRGLKSLGGGGGGAGYPPGMSHK